MCSITRNNRAKGVFQLENSRAEQQLTPSAIPPDNMVVRELLLQQGEGHLVDWTRAGDEFI